MTRFCEAMVEARFALFFGELTDPVTMIRNIDMVEAHFFLLMSSQTIVTRFREALAESHVCLDELRPRPSTYV